MKSNAKTVEQYLKELPTDRQEAITEVRKVILKYLPKGFEEAMNWGVICYQVPLATYADTYNKQPYMYLGLGSQKNYMVLYLTGLYMDSNARKKFEEDYAVSGKKLNLGGGCLRFKKLEELPLDVIGKYVANTSVEAVIKSYEDRRNKS